MKRHTSQGTLSKLAIVAAAATALVAIVLGPSLALAGSVVNSGEPVVVSAPVGRGAMVVIGDSDFLHNKNLERQEGAIQRNVRFFDWILSRVDQGDAP